jgi:inosine/xanthosine triphosphatase
VKIAVGSTNPVKINAARLAFKKIWPRKKWEVVGVKVASGVSGQPMSDLESIKGATQRAKSALKEGKADYGVGLEGGLQQLGKSWFSCGWAVVVGKKGRIGFASTVRIELPSRIMKLIKSGKELGEADDLLFKRKNSKQDQGFFGLATNGLITRTQGYRDGLIMALTRFLHPELWE